MAASILLQFLTFFTIDVFVRDMSRYYPEAFRNMPLLISGALLVYLLLVQRKWQKQERTGNAGE